MDFVNFVMALSPILVVLVGILGFKQSAKRVSPIALVWTLILAFTYFNVTGASFADNVKTLDPLVWKGIKEGLKIVLMVFGAFTILNLLRETGAIDDVKSTIARISDDRRVQLIVIGMMLPIFLEGAAGAGKTHMLNAVNDYCRENGKRLVIATPTQKAALVAGEEVGTGTGTLMRLLEAYGWRHDETDPEHPWYRVAEGQSDHRGNTYRGVPDEYRLDRDTFLVVDEAGMMDQDQALALLRVADETGARLTLVGDTIKGTPSKAGDFKFTVKATNGGGSDTKELTIKIADAEAAKYHNVTLSGAGTGATGAGSHAAGTTVNIYAGTKSGYTFNGWTSDDVTVLSASSKNASFVMPDKDVTVKANWVYNGGSSGGGYTYYTIKATAGVNGSISPTGNVSVREGSDQTFTITPNKGYAVAKVLIDSKNVGAVKSYTFENVKKNHTIEVVFMKASGNPQTGVFVDVPEGSYYEEAVNWAVEKGITTGTDATHFSPDGICTRAQAVTFLWRAAGSPAAKSAVMPFTDVKAGSYYYDAVLWAVENGITKGTSDTMFSPDATCSRAQIVTFLWRSQKSPAAGTANPFIDVKASAYYADAVLWAVKEDVTKGTTNTTFSPDANCTRAQIVTFIWRALAE